jgi:hypothetical protein
MTPISINTDMSWIFINSDMTQIPINTDMSWIFIDVICLEYLSTLI